MHADVIYVLEKGKIVEIGTHDQLLENKGLYYAMWRQQVGERRTVYVEAMADEDKADEADSVDKVDN
jgi:ABC-type glutathione transport system ATPase component